MIRRYSSARGAAAVAGAFRRASPRASAGARGSGVGRLQPHHLGAVRLHLRGGRDALHGCADGAARRRRDLAGPGRRVWRRLLGCLERGLRDGLREHHADGHSRHGGDGARPHAPVLRRPREARVPEDGGAARRLGRPARRSRFARLRRAGGPGCAHRRHRVHGARHGDRPGPVGERQRRRGLRAVRRLLEPGRPRLPGQPVRDRHALARHRSADVQLHRARRPERARAATAPRRPSTASSRRRSSRRWASPTSTRCRATST